MWALSGCWWIFAMQLCRVDHCRRPAAHLTLSSGLSFFQFLQTLWGLYSAAVGSTLKVFALSKSSSLPYENPQVHSIPRLFAKKLCSKPHVAQTLQKQNKTKHIYLCRFIAKRFVLSSVRGHKWKRTQKSSELPQGRLGKAFLHDGYLSPGCDWSQQVFGFHYITCFRAKACLPSPLLLSLCFLDPLWWCKATPENSSGAGDVKPGRL